MIDYREIRIGNIAYDNYGQRSVIMTVRTGETIDDMNQYPDNYSPVPITPEWLERMGFKRLKDDFKIGNFFIHKRERGFVMNIKVPVITSVHQLQNLYFALTGKELEIKP